MRGPPPLSGGFTYLQARLRLTWIPCPRKRTYIYIYIYPHTHTNKHPLVSSSIPYTPSYLATWPPTYIRADVHTHIHTRIPHTCTYVINIHTFLSLALDESGEVYCLSVPFNNTYAHYIHPSIHPSMHACMHACMHAHLSVQYIQHYVCIYIYIYKRTHMHTHLDTFTTCLCVSVHASMYSMHACFVSIDVYNIRINCMSHINGMSYYNMLCYIV